MGNRRLIYQNQFVYISPQALEPHFNNGSLNDQGGVLRNEHWSMPNGNSIRQLHRIQSLDYGFKVNNIDINQYGLAGKVSTVPLGTPDVYINFEYLFADGYNELVSGFKIDGVTPALYDFMTENIPFGQNIFIVLGPDGHDIIGADLSQSQPPVSVVGIGNAFLSQYAFSAEVGSMPKARLSFEAFNVRSYRESGVNNLPLPSINSVNQSACFPYRFSLPDTFDSFTYPGIGTQFNQVEFNQSSPGVSPGGIKIGLDDAGIISENTKETILDNPKSANIQGFTVNIPMPMVRINRLGSIYEYNRTYQYPNKLQIKCVAYLSELKRNNLVDFICKNPTHNIVLSMHDICNLDLCNGNLHQRDAHLVFYFKQALLDTEAFESSVQSNAKTVELTFSLDHSDPETVPQNKGFYIFGKSFFPERPKIMAWGHPL